MSQAGSFYAIYLIESLGVKGDGGVVRIGFTHYNTTEEIERVIQALKKMSLEMWLKCVYQYVHSLKYMYS